MKEQIIYYKDELKDEFSNTKIVPKKIDGDYQYIYTSKWKKFTHFFWYRIIATPIAMLYLKLYFGHKIINKEVLRDVAETGWIQYGNHTQGTADVIIPSVLSLPRDNYVIVNPENVSIPILGKLTPSLGAIPLPDDGAAARRFLDAVKTRLAERKVITIYPEAHIWPYYTGIRPFGAASFRYAIQYHVPVYCFTNTYQKRRFTRVPRIVTYVDGPFFPREELKGKEQLKELRNRVYDTMVKRSKNSNVEMIIYQRAEEEND